MAKFKKGDRVRILKPHEAGHDMGEISSVSTETAYAVRMDGMDEDHKWYVDSEMEKMAMDNRRSTGVRASNVTPLRNRAATPNGYKMVNRKGRGEIYLYGIIGDSWFGDGITASQFAKDLKALGAVDAIDLRINSDGGSVTHAESIYTHLVEHKARVTTHIDGIAASAASYIAMAGDEILIADGGFVMIHEARSIDYGTAEDFRRMADLLDKTNDRIVAKYKARTKNEDKQLRAWMAEEKWFVGPEAVEHGFADRVVENLKIAACISDPSRFRNLPAALRQNRARASVALAAMGIARK